MFVKLLEQANRAYAESGSQEPWLKWYATFLAPKADLGEKYLLQILTDASLAHIRYVVDELNGVVDDDNWAQWFSDHMEATLAKPFEWSFTGTFQIARAWVADGFELTEERLKDILQRGLADDLQYARDDEIVVSAVAVTSAPDDLSIRHAQGY